MASVPRIKEEAGSELRAPAIRAWQGLGVALKLGCSQLYLDLNIGLSGYPLAIPQGSYSVIEPMEGRAMDPKIAPIPLLRKRLDMDESRIQRWSECPGWTPIPLQESLKERRERSYIDRRMEGHDPR